MPVDLKAAVSENMNELRKAIARLKEELERYKSVMALLSRNGSTEKLRARNGPRRSRGDLEAVLNRLPGRFSSKDFMRAAARAGKSSVYLRQILSRWAKRGKIKRLQKGKYRKVKRAGAQRIAA